MNYRKGGRHLAGQTVPATADPEASDEVLATQPVGYWSGLAH